tara:strand:+ start:18294 stop:19172 length:879 start_codon:yes stop_codon:yes gene_type:complete
MRGMTKKKIKIGCLTLLLGFIVLTQIVSSCVSLTKSDREVAKYFRDKPVQPRSVFYNVDGYAIHYKQLDVAKNGTIVFLHGSPGGWDAFIDYFADSTLYQNVSVVAVDRPGYGKSEFGKPVGSIEKQAALLQPMLEALPAPRVIVGHSLGGPIAARLAMDYPDWVDGLVLLAPALDPRLEPNEDWFRKPMRWPLLSALVPKIIRVSNEELIFLEEELEQMLLLWPGVQAKTIVVQGGEDGLVHPQNANFADSMLINAQKEVIFLPKQNHFLPWNEYALVKQKALELMREFRQ